MFMQLLNGVLVALAVLASAAIAVSLAMLTAPSLTRPGQPHGGIRPDPPQHPQPDTDDARTLVLHYEGRESLDARPARARPDRRQPQMRSPAVGG